MSVFDHKIFKSQVKSEKVKIFPELSIGYFIGPVLALISNTFLSSYLNKYYTDVLGFTSWAASFAILLPIVSVIFVVLGNILVGLLMNKNSSKAGKARPLLLIGAPLTLLAFVVIFFVTPLPVAAEGGEILLKDNIATLIWSAVGYNLYFAIAYPFYYTSHSALVTLSTREDKSRSLLATVSNATALAAMGLCSMILPFFIDMLFTGDPVTSYNAIKWFALVVAILCLIGGTLEFLFTRERITEANMLAVRSEEKKTVSTGAQAKACMSDKYWWIIMVFFFLYQLGGCLKNNSQLYFAQAAFSQAADSVEEVIKIGGQWSGTIAIVGAIPTAIGMLVVWPLTRKFSKGQLILGGAIFAVIGGAIGFIDVTNPYLVITSFVIKALGASPAMYISLALLANVLDHQEVKHGFRSDGLTMTIYGAIMVGMIGIANGIINGVLNAAGYSSATIETLNGPSITNAMSFTFIGGETICYVAIAILFIFMNVEKYSKQDEATLKERQAVLENKAEAKAE